MTGTNYTAINAKSISVNGTPIYGIPTGGPKTKLGSTTYATGVQINGSTVLGSVPAGVVPTTFTDLDVAALSQFNVLTLLGTSLRGYSLTGINIPKVATTVIQDRTGAGSAWTDTAATLPLALVGANVGRGYRIASTVLGVTTYSDPVGPIGVSDTTASASDGFSTKGKNIIAINTAAVGYAASKGWVRGIDYFDTMSYYEDDMGENINMDLRVPVDPASTGGVVFYALASLNNYDQGVAQSVYDNPIQNDNVGALGPFTWDLTYTGTGSVTHLAEWYEGNVNSNAPSAIANTSVGQQNGKTNEIGIVPHPSPEARGYFEGNTPLGTYVDENALPWGVWRNPPPSSIWSGFNPFYTILMPPSGNRNSGSLDLKRLHNFLLSIGVTKSDRFITGLASGIEMTGAGGAAKVTGKFLPKTTNFAWTPASAYTFDTDVTAYFSRFTNRPGIDVRKAVDAFIVALKAAGLYTLIDDMFFFRAAGAADMRRAFKNASRDLVDSVGTARYVAQGGLSYSTLAAPGAGRATARLALTRRPLAVSMRRIAPFWRSALKATREPSLRLG
jgi:hypothetical protein